MRRLVPAGLLALLLSLAPSASHAQQPRPPAPRGPTPAAPLPPPEAAAGPTQPIEIPPPPNVDDPMLAPMPPAQRNIGNWEEALALVRSRSTDLRIAYDEVLIAEARSRIALAGALFSLNANGSYTHQFLTKTTTATGVDTSTTPPTTFTTSTTSPLPDVAVGSISFSQPILAPRAWYAIGTAHRAEDFAKLSVEDAKRQIALAVANALIAVVTSERIAELNRIGFRSALERLELTQRKKNLGAATGLDVVRSQQDVEQARATLVSGDESLRQSRESLGLALGFPQPIGVTHDVSLDGLEKSAVTACHGAPLDERADIAAARKRIELSERGVTDAKLQFSPTAVLNSTLAATTATSNVTPNPTWNIQALLTIPIWEGGARYGALREARATLDQSEQELIAKHRQAEIQVAQAQRNVSVAEASRKVAADARQLAAETDRLTRIGYVEGQGTSLELVTAAAALRQAEINLALRDFDVVRARVLAILALANCPF